MLVLIVVSSGCSSNSGVFGTFWAIRLSGTMELLTRFSVLSGCSGAGASVLGCVPLTEFRLEDGIS